MAWYEGTMSLRAQRSNLCLLCSTLTRLLRRLRLLAMTDSLSFIRWFCLKVLSGCRSGVLGGAVNDIHTLAPQPRRSDLRALAQSLELRPTELWMDASAHAAIGARAYIFSPNPFSKPDDTLRH